MNTKNLKRWVLAGVIIMLAIVSITWYPLELGFCKNIREATTSNTRLCMDLSILPEVVSSLVFFLSLSLIFLSLLTYWAKDELFRAWWNFARWWVPVIIVTTLLLESAGGGGTLGMDSDFTLIILSILYLTLILTSLVKISKTYLHLHWKDKGISGDHLIKIQHRTNKIIWIAILAILVIIQIVTSMM